MKLTVVKIIDRFGKQDHRCLESHHYVTLLSPGQGIYRASLLAYGDFSISDYSSSIELICGMDGMSFAISELSRKAGVVITL